MDFSDTQSLVSCRHCAELLQEGDRFCRFCGQDQWEGDDATFIDVSLPDSREAALTMPGRSVLAAGTAARAFPMVARPVAGRPAPEAELPEVWERNARGGSPVMMGIAAFLMLLFGVMLVYDLYTERRRDAERVEQLGVQVEQMQRALDQGELGAVERILRSLGNDASSDPRVAALTSTLRRQQEALRAPVEEAEVVPVQAPEPTPPPARAALEPAPLRAPASPSASASPSAPASLTAPASSTAAALTVDRPANAPMNVPIEPPARVAPAAPAAPEAAPSSGATPVLTQSAPPAPASADASTAASPNVVPLNTVPPSAPSDAPPNAVSSSAVSSSAVSSSAAAPATLPATVAGPEAVAPDPSPGCSEALSAMALCPQP